MLSPAEINELSNIVDRTAEYVPHDYNRRPENFEYFSSFKASSLRRLLLCDGFVVFSTLKTKIKSCYLLLHAGIYILSSPRLSKDPLSVNLAETVLLRFVKKSEKVFGKHFVVYNVHSLIHLAQECRVHNQCLENFSAYKYENVMGVIRKLLRSTNKPIHQLANRDKERQGRLFIPKDRLKQDDIVLRDFHRGDDEGRHLFVY